MRGMILGCCAMCAGGGAYMYNNANSGIDYDGTVAAVHTELASMPMPDELGDSVKGGGSGSIRTDTSKPDEVRWHFDLDGHEIGLISARLRPVDGDTTNVQVEWDPGNALPKGSSARALAMQPMIEQVAETFMAEQIDSTLEDHPFDKRSVGLQLAAYVSTHPKEMKQYMAKVQALSESAAYEGEYKPRMKGESRPPEARFDPGKPMVSAKPMSDLSSYNCRSDDC